MHRLGISVLLLVWAGVSAIALWWLTESRQQVFGMSEVLTQTGLAEKDYLQQWQPFVFSLVNQGQPVLVRIEQPECDCNTVSEVHWLELPKLYPSTQFVRVSWFQLPTELRRLVPATPMALYLNADGYVRYAGPFSSGALCSSDNSLIEAFVTGRTQQRFIPLNVKGCYCRLAANSAQR